MSRARGTEHATRGDEELPGVPLRRTPRRAGKKRTDFAFARKAVGLTQEQLAEAMRVQRETVIKWEGGDNRPQPYLWPKLARILMISPERLTEILTKDNEPSGNSSEPIGENHVRHPLDGRLMARVDGSVFLAGPGNVPVWLPTFYIDVYPVTNAEYAQFISATGHVPPQHWEDGRHSEALSDHPVVFATWNDAAAYTQWAGKSLPSAQQWEKAARGTRGTVYPWGNQPTPAKCNVRENGVGSTTPVDCYQSGVSPYGLFDMCGNIWEWCSTETKPGRHELKGGAWTSPLLRATPSSFNDAAATMSDDDTGFRCAVTTEALDN
jgi:transcriptional regulator with XRE-family HTH domain